MLEQIHTLPNLLILVLSVLLFGGAAFAAPFAGRRLLRRTGDGAPDAAVFDAFLAVMAMAGVVLAFSLVQADGNLRVDEGHVGREASAIIVADRELQRIGLPGADAVRVGLADFVQSQAGQEWPGLAHGRDPRTDRRYAELSRLAGRLEPASHREEVLYAGLVRALDEVSDARESLIQDASLHLPPIFWIVAVSFVVLGWMLAALSEATLARAAALGLTAAAMGLLFSFVLIVDQPFVGQTGLKPGPITAALTLGKP